jgi:hypothetical protein
VEQQRIIGIAGGGCGRGNGRAIGEKFHVEQRKTLGIAGGE